MKINYSKVEEILGRALKEFEKKALLLLSEEKSGRALTLREAIREMMKGEKKEKLEHRIDEAIEVIETEEKEEEKALDAIMSIDEQLAESVMENLVEESLEEEEEEEVDSHDLELINGLKKDFAMMTDEIKKSVYEELSLDAESLRSLVDAPENLEPEDWQKLKKIRERSKEYKQKTRDLDKQYNDELVVKQRKKQKAKLFNIRDGWFSI